MENYRINYRAKYGEIPKGWHLHHIDIDDSNHEAENLVALPSTFHKRYHYYRNCLKGGLTMERIHRFIDRGIIDKYITNLMEFHKLELYMRKAIKLRDQFLTLDPPHLEDYKVNLQKAINSNQFIKL